MVTSCRKENAIVFIDGSNLYHAMKKLDLLSSKIDYWNFARRLSRENHSVVEIRYYVGKVCGELNLSRSQNKFLNLLKTQDVKVVLGRVEKKPIRPENNPIQQKLKDLLASHGHLIKDSPILDELENLISEETYDYVEKRVDVNLAIDMVEKATKNEFDVAYLVSADGDFVPAVEVVRKMEKKVFAATPGFGRELGRAVNGFIPLRKEWFSGDLFLDSPTK